MRPMGIQIASKNAIAYIRRTNKGYCGMYHWIATCFLGPDLEEKEAKDALVHETIHHILTNWMGLDTSAAYDDLYEYLNGWRKTLREGRVIK